MSKTISEIPQLIRLWDKTNILNPHETSTGSHKKALWVCKRGHKWESIIRSLIKKIECPYCIGKKAIPGENDLGTLYPHLQEEWNDKTSIYSFLPNSNYKAEWKCKLNHIWETSIAKRALRNQNCPYCGGYRFLKDLNDVKTLYPNLIKEWIDDKNSSDFMFNSSEKVLWKCLKNHEYITTIKSRTLYKTGCPYCERKIAIKGENDFATLHPEFIPEWNDEKDPSDFLEFSGYKAQWKCSKNHVWKVAISERSKGRKCPYCSNKKVLPGFNDLATTHPHLIKEWFDKNKTPYEITYGSGYKAQWKCDKGHVWKMQVTSRTSSKKNQNCPYCANKKIVIGFNDLSATNPELIDEWDDEKPIENFSKGSNYKANWKCKKHGHKWTSMINSRAGKEKYGCPVCSGNKVLEGFNDLLTTHPELEKEWNDKKNITDFSKGSGYKAHWICSKGHIWISSIHQRASRKDSCPYCAGKRTIVGETDLLTTYPEVAKKWDFEKNSKKPTDVSRGSDYYAHWKCEYGHEWQCKVNDMTQKNLGCPVCSGNRFISGINDIATKMPHLIKEWNDAEDIKNVYWKKGKKRYNWLCPIGHEYAVSPYRRHLGFGCPYCAQKKLLIGFNDFETKFSELLIFWNYEKNIIKPSEITAFSSKKVWWICDKNKNHEWAACVGDVTYGKSNCPHCANHISNFEKEVNQFIKSLGFETTTSNRSIISPKELDIVIESKKIAIECNGIYWHSDKFIRKNKNMSAVEFHTLKKDLAKTAGYDLFFVWQDDWDDNQDLVKQELSQILNNNYENITLLNRLE